MACVLHALTQVDMRNFFRKLLSAESPAASPSASVSPPAALAEVIEEPTLVERTLDDPLGLGLRDAVRSGWYRQDTGELYTGFKVSAEDVVLDVGCGDGGNALFCANRGAHVILADIDAERLAKAAQRLAGTPAREVRTIVGDTNPLALADGVASKVIAMEVLEHVDDTAQFLSELLRVGKPGAQYLLSVPDPVQEQLQTHLAPAFYFQKPNHVRIIQRDEFAQMVSDAGLVIESRGSYGFYWAVWWSLFWSTGLDVYNPLVNPRHPQLDNWTRTWEALLDNPEGEKVRQTLNAFMPKSQVIVARKPYA